MLVAMLSSTAEPTSASMIGKLVHNHTHTMQQAFREAHIAEFVLLADHHQGAESSPGALHIA